MLSNGFLDEDRYILLYGSSAWSLGDTFGLVLDSFDIETSRAMFIADYNDADAFSRHTWGWLPLEDILSGYLDMINERKVTPVQWQAMGHLGPNGEAGDLQKAVSAMRRLIDSIEARLDLLPQDPWSPPPHASLPWHDAAAFSNKRLVPPGTFAQAFLKAISVWTVRFRFIAPGIRFPTLAEFFAQSSQPGHYHNSLLIFQVDYDSDHDADGSDQFTDLPRPWPPGGYIHDVLPGGDYHFANEFRLELPFRVVANGFANQSSGQPLGVNIMERNPKPKGARHELYQSGFPTGFTHIRSVPVHKVLDNWAGMVEKGHWVVDREGVAGGIRKFKNADTEEQWESRQLMIRFPLPYKVGEDYRPGNADENVRCEAGTYAWMQENCPTVPIPQLYGFGLSTGEIFTHIDHLSLISRTYHRLRRCLLRWLKYPTPSRYVRREAKDLGLGVPYLLIDYIDPSQGKMLSETWADKRDDRQLRTNLFHGLARIMLAVARTPVPKIGSFVLDSNGYLVLGNRPLTMGIQQLENKIYQLICHGTACNLQWTHILEDGLYQTSALMVIKSVWSCFFRRDLCRGPFVFTLTDLNQSNIFVDEDWNIKCLVDLEWACSLPTEMVHPPYWLSNQAIDCIQLDNYEPLHTEFLDALADEERYLRGADPRQALDLTQI
ncbi:hypothetical protein HK57_00505 [Aspergillus ustus]|uniref:Aminoglycoside phosphotransferase domain-containing protein n=1 Tax=Aspergillus ustus TaxID=40382 RepID=A0A0C1C3R5_ASPUT|nr:hypothetical protein HK57_00505 [Aspergillus ustus]